MTQHDAHTNPDNATAYAFPRGVAGGASLSPSGVSAAYQGGAPNGQTLVEFWPRVRVGAGRAQGVLLERSNA